MLEGLADLADNMLGTWSGPHKGNELHSILYTPEGQYFFPTLREAKAAARRTPQCRGVTLEEGGTYTLKASDELYKSLHAQASWLFKVSPWTRLGQPSSSVTRLTDAPRPCCRAHTHPRWNRAPPARA
jgi:hypothetical protein